MTGRYDDIIDRPHPVSRRHPQMTMSGRAAQFSSFAALSGYEDAVRETARQTDRRVELSEDALALIDAITSRIAAMDEAAQAEFTALLNEIFPIFMTEDNVEQTEIVIELKVKGDDSIYRLERYTFRLEDGVWYFTSLAAN